MHLSVKNMILAFAIGLVVFSLLMTALCVAMFNSEIDVAKKDAASAIEKQESFSYDNAIAFTVEKSEGGLSFAVLTLIDTENKTLFLTPMYGDYLIPYKNALSYVSNVYYEMGDKMLPEAIKAFSGVVVSQDNVFKLEGVVNYEGFKSVLLPRLAVVAGGDFSGYTVKDVELELKENQTENTHEQIKQVDTEKSVAKFRNLFE